AQVGGGQHISSLRRVRLGDAEMQEDASAELAQLFDGKYLGLDAGHAPPCRCGSLPLIRAGLVRAFPHQRVSAVNRRQKRAKSWRQESRVSRSAAHLRQLKR